MKKQVIVLLTVIVMSIIFCSCNKDSTPEPINNEPVISSRSFYMGFTPFPYDVTASSLDDVYNKIESDADFITHHLDNGIPWNEALVDAYPYDNNIMNDWSTRLSKTPIGHKTLLIITPIGGGRDGLADYRKENDGMALVSPFDIHGTNKDFDHIDVKTAYLNYCKRIINYFSPSYLGIGIEVNLLRKNTDQSTWNKYIALQSYIYDELKLLYPNLPVFASLEALEALEGYPLGIPAEFGGDATAYANSQKTAIDNVLLKSDYYALSMYPFKMAYYNSDYPSTMFDDVFALNNGKTIAIAETGYTAESFDAYGITFVGSELKQKNFVDDLLVKSNQYDVEFVTYFVLQDYDLLCASLGLCGVDAFKIWKDTGLYDGLGNERNSLAVWKSYLSRPLN